MALAVAEAHRVLRPAGQLLDIHPQGQPLRLDLWEARAGQLPEDRHAAAFDRQTLGSLAPEEMVQDFLASSQAIAQAAGRGFSLGQAIRFDYRFFFNTLDELTEYLEENEELDLADDALLEQALLALRQATAPAQLVLIQPVIATRLHKA